MRYFFGFLMALAVFAFVACGGEGADCADPVADVTGEWKIHATPITDTCGGDLTPYTFFITATQEGNALTSQTPEGTMTGTICGDQVRMSLRSTEDGGTATVNMELTVSPDGNAAEGSDTWRWTSGAQSCGGSESLSAISNLAPIYDACHNGENCVQSADLCEELSVDFAGFTYVNAICILTCETEGPLSPDCPRALVGRSGSCYPSSVAGGITDALICFEPCDFLEDCQVGFRCFGALDLCGADFTSCPIDQNDAICVPGPS